MKTAISVPDPLYDSVEQFVKAAGISRSQFYQRAARLFLRSVSARAITASLDRVHAAEEQPGDAAFRRAALSHLRDVLGQDGR